MDGVKPIELLIVDENDGDIELTKKALQRAKVVNRLKVARDGDEAISILKLPAGSADHIDPDLILLDLNLPKQDGREILDKIKADPQLRRISVVILTSSKAEEDVLKSRNVGANGYITKPVDTEQFVKVVKSINEFWFQIVRLPGQK